MKYTLIIGTHVCRFHTSGTSDLSKTTPLMLSCLSKPSHDLCFAALTSHSHSMSPPAPPFFTSGPRPAMGQGRLHQHPGQDAAARSAPLPAARGAALAPGQRGGRRVWRRGRQRDGVQASLRTAGPKCKRRRGHTLGTAAGGGEGRQAHARQDQGDDGGFGWVVGCWGRGGTHLKLISRYLTDIIANEADQHKCDWKYNGMYNGCTLEGSHSYWNPFLPRSSAP